MSDSVCISCRRPKAVFKCGVCEEPLCKDCDQFLDAGTFSFLKTQPAELGHTHYCPSCHAGTVEPALESYEEVMERAKTVYFFFTTQKRPPPIVKKSKEKVQVAECADRDETILRLAFFAAEQGYNGIVEAEVTSEKVRNEGYQKMRWRGVGLPVTVDAEKLERESRRNQGFD